MFNPTVCLVGLLLWAHGASATPTATAMPSSGSACLQEEYRGISLALHTQTVEENEANSPKVPVSHWAYAAFAQLQRHKILIGYPDGFFKGKRVLTRYDFAVAVKRTVDALLYEPPDNVGATGPPDDADWRLRILSEEIMLVRRLVRAFTPELVTLKVDAAAQGVRLQKFQDWVIRKQIAVKLEADKPTTLPANPPSLSSDFQPTDWGYKEFAELIQRGLIQFSASDGAKHRFTRYEAGVSVKRVLDAFCASERHESLGNADSVSVGKVKPSFAYNLADIVDLIKLTQALQGELTSLKADITSIQAWLSLAEKRQITLEETMDAKPPTVGPSP